MGIQAYLASKSRKYTASLNGQPIEVAPFKWLCKAIDLDRLFGSDYQEKRSRLLNATVARCEQAWGGNDPEFVSLGGDGGKEDGSYVYRNAKGILYFDTDSPGELVGVLHKVGRSWVVVPMTTVDKHAERLLRLLDTGCPRAQTSLAALLGLSEGVAEAVFWRLHCKGFATTRFNGETRTQEAFLTDKGREALHSDDLEAYWTAVRAG